MRDYHYSCRKCSGCCIRHGKSKNKQRWKCKSCGTAQFRVYKPKTINRRTRVVIDFMIGRRTKATVNKLIEKLKKLHPKKIRTDKWQGYKTLFADIPKEIHKEGRRITNRIERQGSSLINQGFRYCKITNILMGLMCN